MSTPDSVPQDTEPSRPGPTPGEPILTVVDGDGRIVADWATQFVRN